MYESLGKARAGTVEHPQIAEIGYETVTAWMVQTSSYSERSFVYIIWVVLDKKSTLRCNVIIVMNMLRHFFTRQSLLTYL